MNKLLLILAIFTLSTTNLLARSEMRFVDALPYPSIFVRPAGQAHLVSVEYGPTVRRLFTAGQMRGQGQALTFLVDKVYDGQNFYLHYPRFGMSDLPMIFEVDGVRTLLDNQPNSSIDEWVIVMDGALFEQIVNARSSFRFWGRLEDGTIGWITFEAADLAALQEQLQAILSDATLPDIQEIWQAERLSYYR
jgi:hypothetical protein